MLRNCDGCTVLCFCMLCSTHLEHLFLVPGGWMSGTFFSQEHMFVVLFISLLLTGIRHRGGPRLVGCGDVFTHFLITISFTTPSD